MAGSVGILEFSENFHFITTTNFQDFIELGSVQELFADALIERLLIICGPLIYTTICSNHLEGY